MAVKLTKLSLAALALALPVSHIAVAQTSYVGGGSVIVNMQALDRLGPPLPGFAGAQNPQAAVLGGMPKPLLGETGPETSSKRSSSKVKLRPPAASKASRAATASASATPAVANTPTPAPKAASKPVVAKPAPAKRPSTQTPVASVNLPPPSISTPSISTPSVSVPSVSVPSISAPAVTAAPATGPAAGMPLQLPTPPSAAPTPAPLTAAPAPAPMPAAAAPPAAPTAAPTAAAPLVRPPASSNPASQQTALLTPPPAASAAPTPLPGGAGQVNLVFEPGKSELAGNGSAALEAMARSLSNTEDRIQIRAYASASGADAASGARRLSLSRALAVRGFLIDRGIRSTRIDVRALGAPTDNSPADRVEVVTVGR